MTKLTQEQRQFLSQSIRIIPNFPKKGIIFRDITTLLNDSKSLTFLLNHLSERYKNMHLDFIVGTESRGFIFAAMLCSRLNLAFVPIRKANKLPSNTYSCEYELEYGMDRIEIHQDAFKDIKNPKILLIDDLIATGGTALASFELIQKAGGRCVEACFLIKLKNLGGEERLKKLCPVYSILEF